MTCRSNNSALITCGNQRRQSLSNKSINNTLIPLRKVFSRAFEDGIVIQNPMARVRWLPVQSRGADPFSREEATKVLLELATRSLEVANYFQFAFATGLRTSELMALPGLTLISTCGVRRLPRRRCEAMLRNRKHLRDAGLSIYRPKQ